MSLTAEVKVNRDTIAHVHCQRHVDLSKPQAEEKPDDVYTYVVKVDLPHRGKGVAVIEHRYGDGALVLLRKALETLT